MKIYTREEFMKLPQGTLFCKGKPWYFHSMNVKGETIVYGGKPSDFYSRETAYIDAHSSEEALDRLEEMLAKGTSYPMEVLEGRDGCFDPADLFLVYEQDDLTQLSVIVRDALLQSRKDEIKPSA